MIFGLITFLICSARGTGDMDLTVCDGACPSECPGTHIQYNSTVNLTKILLDYSTSDLDVYFYTASASGFSFKFAASGIRGSANFKKLSNSGDFTLIVNVDSGKVDATLNFGDNNNDISVVFESTKSVSALEINGLQFLNCNVALTNIGKEVKTCALIADKSIHAFDRVNIIDCVFIGQKFEFDVSEAPSGSGSSKDEYSILVKDQEIDLSIGKTSTKTTKIVFADTNKMSTLIKSTNQKNVNVNLYPGTKASSIPNIEFRNVYILTFFDGDWPETTKFSVTDKSNYDQNSMTLISYSKVLPISRSQSYTECTTYIKLNQTSTVITGSIVTDVVLSLLMTTFLKNTTVALKGEFSGHKFDLGSSYIRCSITNLKNPLTDAMYPFIFRLGIGGASTVSVNSCSVDVSKSYQYSIMTDFQYYLSDNLLSALINKEWKILTLYGVSLSSQAVVKLPSEPFIHGFIEGDSVVSLSRPPSADYVVLTASSPDSYPLFVCYDNGDDLCDGKFAVEIFNIESLTTYFKPSMKVMRLTLMKYVNEIDLSSFDIGYQDCQIYISGSSSSTNVGKMSFGSQRGITYLELTNLKIDSTSFFIEKIKFSSCTASTASSMSFHNNKKVIGDDDFLKTFVPRTTGTINFDYIMDLYDAMSIDDKEYVFYDLAKNGLAEPAHLSYEVLESLNIIYDIGMTTTAEENDLNVTMNTLKPPNFNLTFDRISQEYRNEAELILYKWESTKEAEFNVNFDHGSFPVKIVLTQPYNPKQINIIGNGKVTYVNRYDSAIEYCVCEGDNCKAYCPSSASQIAYKDVDTKLLDKTYTNYTFYVSTSTQTPSFLLKNLDKKVVSFVGLAANAKDIITINNDAGDQVAIETTTTKFSNLNILVSDKTTKLSFGELEFSNCTLDSKFKSVEMDIDDFFCTFSMFSLFKKVTIHDNCIVTGEMAVDATTVDFIPDENANDLQATIVVDAKIEMGNGYIKIGQTCFNIERSEVYDCVINANKEKSIEITKAPGASDSKIPLVLFRNCNSKVKFSDGWEQNNKNYIFLFNEVHNSIITLMGENTPISVSVDSGDFKIVSGAKATGINGKISYASSIASHDLVLEYASGLSESSITFSGTFHIGAGFLVKFSQPNIKVYFTNIEGSSSQTALFDFNHYSNVDGDSQVIIQNKLVNAKLSNSFKVICPITGALTDEKIQTYVKIPHVLLKVYPSDTSRSNNLDFIGSTKPTTHGFIGNLIIGVDEYTGYISMLFMKSPELVPWEVCYKTSTACEIMIDESSISTLNKVLPAGSTSITAKFGESNTNEFVLGFKELNGLEVSVSSTVASKAIDVKMKFGSGNVKSVSLSRINAKTVESSFKVTSLTLTNGASINNLSGFDAVTIDFDTWKVFKIASLQNNLTLLYDQALLTFTQNGWRLNNNDELTYSNFPKFSITFTSSSTIDFEADSGLTAVKPLKISTSARRFMIGSNFDAIKSPIIEFDSKYDSTLLTVTTKSFPFVIFPKLMTSSTLQIEYSLLPYTAKSEVGLNNLRTIIDFSNSDDSHIGQLYADKVAFDGVSALGEKGSDPHKYDIIAKNVEIRHQSESSLIQVEVTNSLHLIGDSSLMGMFDISAGCEVTYEWRLDQMPEVLFDVSPSTDKDPKSIVFKFLGGDSISGLEEKYNDFLLYKSFPLAKNIGDESRCLLWKKKVTLQSSIKYFNSTENVFDIECNGGNLMLIGRRPIPFTPRTPTPSDDDDSGSKGLSPGGVAGVTITVLVLVAAAVAGGYYFYRKKMAGDEYLNLNSEKLESAQQPYMQNPTNVV